eukprot:CAMPEP_0195297122 /NCGR_PEP_ID=MMETSP0707-20130614/20872_1 /TAXON_ID=33640 /ORGANISM="Asterionellopsis glacialis, Strain CCMP134" /LENGTH=224 /DNA_ID=CAMNT_0040358835 /DNA_START=8 /DNA_END=682 /DNA_ORIENTATION=-
MTSSSSSIDDLIIPLKVPDEDMGYDSASYAHPPEYNGHLKSVMISNRQIKKRVKDLARIIHRDYNGRRIVMICVLKGASTFYHDLLSALMELNQGFDMEFLRCKSYEGAETTGQIKISGGLDFEHLKNKHVMVVEDILDTGTTLSQLLPVLKEKGQPRSVQCCTLLQKRRSVVAKIGCKYTGFSIPDHFIVGYGLDYNELYRDLKDIWVISNEGIRFDASTLHP